VSSAHFDVTLDATDLVKQIRAFEKRGGDLSPTMAIIAEDLVSAVSDEFDTEGHGKWPALAESTLASRRRRGKGAKILQDTGRWAGSHQPQHGTDWAEAASDVEYAIYHVSDAPRSVIPYRSPYDLPEDVFERAEQTILEAIT
jgi:phage gpG-like protein